VKGSVRLDKDERNALTYALAGVDGDAYLYGSRVDDMKKGGDIDVLILSRNDKYKLSQDVAVRFFMRCEEKIDVTVMDPEALSPEEEAFLRVIRKERIQ
jgi:predicted nucleotidyltransferase